MQQGHEAPTQLSRKETKLSRKGRMAQHSGTAPLHVWVQLQRGRACCAMGGGRRPPSCVRYRPVVRQG